jgi:signal transduction histidine kinase/CheY-like chemotaxis protein/HPt (histidine-containing phosphotransfer) domain-containing protein
MLSVPVRNVTAIGSILATSAARQAVRDRVRRILRAITYDAVTPTRIAIAVGELCRGLPPHYHGSLQIDVWPEGPDCCIAFQIASPAETQADVNLFFDSLRTERHTDLFVTRAVKRLERARPITDELVAEMRGIASSKTLDELLDEIQCANDALEANRVELQSALDRARHADQAKRRFLANMSHEIRTPMNGVLGMADVLRGTALTQQQQQAVDLIRGSGESLLAILNDILDVSKIEAGQLQLESAEVDLHALVSHVVHVLAVRAAEADIEISIDIDPKVPRYVFSDTVRLRQILTNLISNAIRFTKGGDVVTTLRLLEHHAKYARVRFSVRDTGMGIPENKLEAIFEEFAQADTSTTREYGGTGLGLTICRNLVELMGGRLQVRSQVGVGSEFYFSCPFILSPETKASSARYDFSGADVAVVGTHVRTRHLIVRYFGATGGTVTEMESAQDALRWLARVTDAHERVPVVVIDRRLTDMIPSDLVRLIHGDPRYEGVRIVSLSWVNEPIGVTTGMVHLTKPLLRDDLLRHVATLIQPDATAEEAAPDVPVSVMRMRILVVDDNAVNLEVARSLIESQGHRVDVVDSGRKAIDAVRSKPYDMVLMDVQMPTMDGMEATRQIRALLGKTGAIPIIALTAHAFPEDRERFLAAGMNAYVSKPFIPKELYALLQRFARRMPVALDEFRANMRESGVEEKVDAILRMYVKDARGKLHALMSALDSGNADEINSSAHAFKSSSRTIGAMTLGDLLEEIEIAAKRGEVAKAQSLGPALERETDAVLRYLDGILAPES